MKRFLIYLIPLLAIFLLLQHTVVAQATAQTTLQGRVLDQNRKPVQGVTVAAIDQDQRIIRAVSTDVEGNYVIRLASKADSLTFSYIGNETIIQPIGSRSTINITMRTTSAGLGEVIVVAQRRTDNGLMPIADRNLTTATTKINAKEMEEMQAASIDQALQGRLTGCRYYSCFR